MASIPEQPEWKKRSERHKHCALAVVRLSQKFSPHHRPQPGGAGWPKFNQLGMVTTFTYRPSLVKIDSRNFELSWWQIHTHTNPQTGEITVHYTAKLSAQCNKPVTEWQTILYFNVARVVEMAMVQSGTLKLQSHHHPNTNTQTLVHL